MLSPPSGGMVWSIVSTDWILRRDTLRRRGSPAPPPCFLFFVDSNRISGPLGPSWRPPPLPGACYLDKVQGFPCLVPKPRSPFRFVVPRSGSSFPVPVPRSLFTDLSQYPRILVRMLPHRCTGCLLSLRTHMINVHHLC